MNKNDRLPDKMAHRKPCLPDESETLSRGLLLMDAVLAGPEEGLRVVELGAQVFGFEQQSALKGFEGCAMAALFQQPLAMLAIVGGAAQAVGLQAGKVGLGVGHCCVGRGRTGAVDGAICGLFRGVACGLRPGAKPNTPQQAGRQQRQA